MHLYGLIVGISIYIGVSYFVSTQKAIPKNKLDWFIFGGIISSIIGARIYHVLDHWSYYSENLAQIPQTWNGGLGIFGGIIGAIIYLTIYCHINHILLLDIVENITPILPLSQSIGRFGNLVNHEIPTWWVESILNLVLFLFIKKYPNHPTSKYLIGYGTIRLFIEMFRQDTWTINSVKIGQLFSIIFIAIGLLLWKTKIKKPLSNSP